jgi:hypothetical protein
MTDTCEKHCEATAFKITIRGFEHEVERHKKVLRMALWTLSEVQEETFRLIRIGQRLYAEEKVWNTCIAIKEILADPMREVQRLGQEIEQEPPQRIEPPAWFPAVENILNEYGLQAIDFVADFKAAMKDAEQSQRTEQEPVAWVCEGFSSDEKHAIDYWQGDVDDLPIGTQLYTTPPAQPPQRTEQNFCSRCGKRTPDLITIHTCTPPRENT